MVIFERYQLLLDLIHQYQLEKPEEDAGWNESVHSWIVADEPAWSKTVHCLIIAKDFDFFLMWMH